LRELAHGIYPSVLGDDGLATALEVLAEQADVPIRLHELAGGRFPTAVENAAYFAVVESLKGATEATVCIESQNGQLVVCVQRNPAGDDAAWNGRLIEIADRVGALDGRLTTNGAAIRAEIPCAS
jgi:signal transduction histidine kinase